MGIQGRGYTCRVLILASTTEDPRGPLLGSDTNGPALSPPDESTPCGFYWTEGHRGVGWSPGWLPPIKVGSGLGIPSAPAVWFPSERRVAVPDIRDLERLQGFEADWTAPAEEVSRRNDRWKLVGNAVSVPVSRWLGERLLAPRDYDPKHDWPVARSGSWPHAAWGDANGGRFESSASMWPMAVQIPRLDDFLRYEGRPLSSRAAAGFLSRLERFGAKVPAAFVADLQVIANAGPQNEVRPEEGSP
jgi:DNA (cytosine-5)-methyltransferase 1